MQINDLSNTGLGKPVPRRWGKSFQKSLRFLPDEATTKTFPSFDECIKTPIRMATLQAYQDTIPVTNKKQAVIAARANLLTSRIRPIQVPRVIYVELIKYEDAIIRMQAKESVRRPLDRNVWLINIEGDFTIASPTASEESFLGNVFVMLLPDEGFLVTWRKLEQP